MIRIALAALVLAANAGAAAPRYKVLTHVSLENRDEPPSFVCLDGLRLLDRNRLVQIGRPVERSDAFTVLDLRTLAVREIPIPGFPGSGPGQPAGPFIDRPAFYDVGNGHAGVLLRAGRGVASDALWAEWDLKKNAIVRTLPLGGLGGGKWLSVSPIGYDPKTKECFVELVRFGARLVTSPNRGGHFDVIVLGVTDTVRTVTEFTTSRKLTSQGPYFDPVRLRSFHVEYAEYAGNTSMGFVVDLATGAVNTFELPPLVYGFAFDPDGRTGYVYSERDGTVSALDFETGKTGRTIKPGRKGHVLDFVAPGVLWLGRNHGMYFFETPSLRQKSLLSPKKIYQHADHLEGSLALPGRVLMRNYENLYLIELPGIGGRVVR